MAYKSTLDILILTNLFTYLFCLLASLT